MEMIYLRDQYTYVAIPDYIKLNMDIFHKF